ncbi:hypothetical protein IWQ49_006425 [Labrenzia sp. EL_126]|nr:hypothetical protein [Labrenzia sp. EL_126]
MSCLFVGSNRGVDRSTFLATLVSTAKLNAVDPRAWLADVLAHIAETPVARVEELQPWSQELNIPTSAPMS